MPFALWSESNPEARKNLRPNFELRSWNDLPEGDRYKIWKYLEEYFFNKDLKRNHSEPYADVNGNYYEFSGDNEEQRAKRTRIYWSIKALNDHYKVESYARNFLEENTPTNACKDFYSIFKEEAESVVMEMLSMYCKVASVERIDEKVYQREGEEDKKFKKRHEDFLWEPFDKFAKDANEVFGQFGLRYYFTRLGITPRQEDKISKEIFEPVMASLSHPQWKEVSSLLGDAFREYRQNTPHGFSNCVTNTVAAVQAFLQILVNGKTGKGEISQLINQAQGKNLIPSDSFTGIVFKDIEGVLMRERQETGVAHPKKEYANSKNARLVLNLALVFFQHCIQHEN